MTQDIIDALRKVAAKFQDKLGDENLMTVAADEIESLRRDRDEARREVCEWLALSEGGTEQEHADEAGWDCFKEDGK